MNKQEKNNKKPARTSPRPAGPSQRARRPLARPLAAPRSGVGKGACAKEGGGLNIYQHISEIVLLPGGQTIVSAIVAAAARVVTGCAFAITHLLVNVLLRGIGVDGSFVTAVSGGLETGKGTGGQSPWLLLEHRHRLASQSPVNSKLCFRNSQCHAWPCVRRARARRRRCSNRRCSWHGTTSTGRGPGPGRTPWGRASVRGWGGRGSTGFAESWSLLR